MSKEGKDLLKGGISASMVIWPLIASIMFIGIINLMIPSSSSRGPFLLFSGLILAVIYILVQIATGEMLSSNEPGLKDDA